LDILTFVDAVEVKIRLI